jgi:hypothetical protein
MTWFTYTMVGAITFSTLSKIAEIDKPRKTLTRGVVIFCVIESAFWITGLVLGW